MSGFSNSIQNRNQIIRPIQQAITGRKVSTKRHHVKQQLEPVKKPKSF